MYTMIIMYCIIVIVNWSVDIVISITSITVKITHIVKIIVIKYICVIIDIIKVIKIATDCYTVIDGVNSIGIKAIITWTFDLITNGYFKFDSFEIL